MKRASVALVAALMVAACNGATATPTAVPATPTVAPATPTGASATATVAPATPTATVTAATPTAPPATPTATVTGPPSESPTGNGDFLACEVSDTGGIDDKGFNQNAYQGLLNAQTNLGIADPPFLESQADTDYARNIQTFIDQGCDIIVTVGFLLGDATSAAATANPEQKFSIVDFAYDPTLPNVLGIVFQMEEPSMMAGYLAAGMSQTGTVATFGGIAIPPVTVFMDGFAAGVNYYNDQKGTDVQLLGWDPATQTGSFTGDFDDTGKGTDTAAGFISEGADVIFAVAGPVGLGAMAAVETANAANPDSPVMFIGVDVDQQISAPEFSDIMLTSVMKRIDNGVEASVAAVIDGTFEGGIANNNLANEGTGLAPYHEFESAVPAELDGEVQALRAAIIDGSVVPADWYAPAP